MINQPPRYLASDRTVRVNHTGTQPAGVDGAVRSERVGHLVRGQHTLCGRTAAGFVWAEPDRGTLRCAECASVPAGHLTHHDLCATGISYRQLDFWCRRGWLHPDPGPTGSGSRRTFPPAELAVAAVMARLVHAGVTPAAAARVARGQALAPGITITVHDTQAVPSPSSCPPTRRPA